MKTNFVPFLAAATSDSRPIAGARTEVVAGSVTASAFRPMSQAPAHPPAAPTFHGEPTVTLEREGGRVARIKVQCPCGNVVELACDYPEPPSA